LILFWNHYSSPNAFDLIEKTNKILFHLNKSTKYYGSLSLKAYWFVTQ
jgi:hypothetical protein